MGQHTHSELLYIAESDALQLVGEKEVLPVSNGRLCT
jgi:hypothetical protein